MILIQAMILYLYRNVFINVQCLVIMIKVFYYYTISGFLKVIIHWLCPIQKQQHQKDQFGSVLFVSAHTEQI